MSAFASAATLLALEPASASEAPPSGTVRLVGTVLNCVDVGKQLAFYETAFGLKVGMTLDHGARREYMLRFSQDPSEAGLIFVHDSAAGSATELVHGNAFERIVLRVNDMDALLSRLDAGGFTHQPVQAAQGYRILLLQDPEGYALEVIQSAAAKQEPGK